jgi:hypothetical protein
MLIKLDHGLMSKIMLIKLDGKSNHSQSEMLLCWFASPRRQNTNLHGLGTLWRCNAPELQILSIFFSIEEQESKHDNISAKTIANVFPM